MLQIEAGSSVIVPYAFVAIVVLLGIALWLGLSVFGAAITAADVRDLGSQVLGGAVVGVAVLIAERMVNVRIEEEREAREQAIVEAQEREERLREQERVRQRAEAADQSNARSLLIRQTDSSGLDFTEPHIGRALGRLLLYEKVIREANFSGANLSGSTFMDVDFSGTKFAGTTLCAAVFKGVSLDGTDFQEADVTGADLGGAYNLNGASFVGAKYDSRTVWPEGFDPRSTEAISLD
jgi:uncharacterized protein YjbI with pentapeptide repeats